MTGADIAEGTRHSDFAARNRVFWIKSRLLIAKRLFANLFAPKPSGRRAPLPASAVPLTFDEHRLYSAVDPRERELELGKVQNLRVAAAAIDGLVLEPGEIFSFWQVIGRPSRAKGYVTGREFRLGCLVPSTGAACAS